MSPTCCDKRFLDVLGTWCAPLPLETLRGLVTDVPRVEADRGQIEQVVMNLAVNGRDAMPRGGTLTIETINFALDEHYSRTHLAIVPGRYVMLTVSDTGIGMTEAVRARLFEPFFTTKEVGRGTGLGLVTVHGIVKRAGGTVNVYSEMGKGSSFNMYFPEAQASTAAAMPPTIVRTLTGSETVLVVEDEVGLRELTQRLLTRRGYTVLTAASADEARALFQKHPSIAVSATDVVMPGASGPELTRELVGERPNLRVIYVSGYTEEAIVHHGVVDTGVAFLHKPFTSEAIALKLTEVLDQELTS